MSIRSLELPKPSIIILGGLGFIGRNLVEYLVENNLVSKILIADKQHYALVGLSPTQKKAFEDERVSFQSANLSREGKKFHLFLIGGISFSLCEKNISVRSRNNKMGLRSQSGRRNKIWSNIRSNFTWFRGSLTSRFTEKT